MTFACRNAGREIGQWQTLLVCFMTARMYRFRMAHLLSSVTNVRCQVSLVLGVTWPFVFYLMLEVVPSRENRAYEKVVDATNCELTTIRQTPFLSHLMLGVVCGLFRVLKAGIFVSHSVPEIFLFKLYFRLRYREFPHSYHRLPVLFNCWSCWNHSSYLFRCLLG